MIEVEMDIYSGRENPRWNLGGPEVAELIDRLAAREAPLVGVHVAPAVLGYRGFILRSSGEDAARLRELNLPATLRVSEALAPGYGLEAEAVLLETGGREVAANEGDFHEAVTTLGGDAERTMAAAAAACTLQGTPWNDFTPWNNAAHQTRNNCYNYASNNRSDTFAQPGRRSGSMVLPTYTVTKVKNKTIVDGYATSCSGTKMKVALVIKPNTAPSGFDNSDFHFYRLNRNSAGTNRWCHKLGGTPATNRDNAGNYITNPETANRGSYTSWGGYIFSPSPNANVS